ncbi:ABC transporter ATP-binding protein [Stomatohabitans albus]|uniref:ABC transporter ATP-binding protein n=1 Tax=Stomatohabitans albus TaxID=3110766 RepID=UPI00300C1B0F
MIDKHAQSSPRVEQVATRVRSQLKQNTHHHVLDVNGLSIDRRGLRLVDHLSFVLKPGQVLGVSGPSGSGKTTLLRCLTGLTTDYAGMIRLPSHRLGMVFQEPRLLPWRTVRANVMLPLKQPDALFRAEEWLERVQLDDVMDMYPAQLSGGMCQRVAIARALAAEPDVLFVDEPFSALDRPLALQLRDRLYALIQSRQLTTIWVSHDTDELEHIATHRLALHGPPGTWSLSPAQAKSNSQPN